MDKRIRNSRIGLIVLRLLGVLGWFFAVCLVILAFSGLLPLTPASVFGTIQWLAGAFISAACGIQTWTYARIMGPYEVRLSPDGVRFLLGKELYLPWSEVIRVTHHREQRSHIYTVSGRGGQVVRFSALTFFRPKRVACEIAAHAGRSVEEG